MDFDEVDRTHESARANWNQRLGEYNTAGIEKLASTYNNSVDCDCVEVKCGSFNMCFKVVFADNVSWAVRFPIPGKVMYPEEKIRREVAVMKFVQENTRIPVPRLITSGSAGENHDPAMGPFIITEWVDGVSLTSLMEEQPRPAWGPILRDDIDEAMLLKIYRQMARIHLELAVHDFDHIGALSEFINDGHSVWAVTSRPMTLKMNEIERAGYVVMDDHSLPPFDSVREYMEYLVQQNVEHLNRQRNSIVDTDDAQRKYILRRQVRAVIEQFVSVEHDCGPFKLICDDLKPGNVIVDPETLDIVALIDLEWAYAGPYQFLFSPPTWLILEDPVLWNSDSVTSYKAKFPLFLRSLEEEEKTWEAEGRLPGEQRMSSLMRHSMETGKFWFEILIREAFEFDGDVLWPNVEPFLQSVDVGMELSEADKADMEAFVKKKVEDLRQYEELQSLLSNE